jgi:hypothetical protein
VLSGAQASDDVDAVSGDELDDAPASDEEEEEDELDVAPKRLAQLAKSGLKLNLKEGVAGAVAKSKAKPAPKGKAAGKATASAKGKAKA